MPGRRPAASVLVMDGIEPESHESAARRATVARNGRAGALVPHDQSATIRELELTILALRDNVIGCEAKLGELRAELARERARKARADELVEIRFAHAANERAILHDLEKQLHDMQASTTWRIGRAIMKPARLLRSTSRPS